MRDPLTWSVNLGRWFGIQVRVSVLFLLFVVVILWPSGKSREFQQSLDAMGTRALAVAVLFGLVLLHEFGHCAAAWRVGGEPDHILIWPLGGLAVSDVPNTPRARLITSAGGPLVNAAVALVLLPLFPLCGAALPLNPFQFPDPLPGWTSWLERAFYINWVLLLFNIIPAFPLDGGNMLRCFLWQRRGFGQATLWAVQIGKVSAIALGVAGAIRFAGEDRSIGPLALISVAVFMYMTARKEREMLEAGLLFDDSLFGYDFSQGYTSLENSSTKVKHRRPTAWQRWKQRRTQLRRQRELTLQQEQERRVDEILAKLHREGLTSLSDEERRFLTRASAKYRSRNKMR